MTSTVKSNLIFTQLLTNIMSQFDQTYFVSKQEHIKMKEDRYKANVILIENLLTLKQKHLLKYNNIQFNMGNHTMEPVETSPFTQVRDFILSNPNFIQKQRNIIQFCKKYTREPIPEEEDKHWRYCSESNLKLMPNFLYM